jgi:hypothetical protein
MEHFLDTSFVTYLAVPCIKPITPVPDTPAPSITVPCVTLSPGMDMPATDIPGDLMTVGSNCSTVVES